MMYDPDVENTEIKNKLKRARIDDNMSNVSALIAMGGRSSLTKLARSKNQLSFTTLKTDYNLASQLDESTKKGLRYSDSRFLNTTLD